MSTNRFPTDEHEHTDLWDQGLQFDVRTLIQRRGFLRLFGGAAAGAALAATGCSDAPTQPTATGTPDGGGTTAAGTGSSPAATAPINSTAPAAVSPIPSTATTPASACVAEVPEETAGPFPGNGSNGPNALAQSGIVRSDIRRSFGTSTRLAEGVPLTVELTIVNTARDCAPMAGAAVYIWHCDREGLYSMYSAGAESENYCRGVQVAGSDGKVRFTTTYPGAYAGRWPHIHFEVYPAMEQATSARNKLITSQLAFPDDVCLVVYASPGYEQSMANHKRTTLQSDGVFRDGWALQMAATTGSVANGYRSSLTVGV